MSKIELIEYLKLNGKTKSWQELANQFNIDDPEKARKAWLKHRKTTSKSISDAKGYKLFMKSFGIDIEDPRSILDRSDDYHESKETLLDSPHTINLEEFMKNNPISKFTTTTTTQTSDSKEINGTISIEIQTLEDLIKHCSIDTNIWNIDKYIQNYWGGNWQVKIFLSKKKVDTDLGKQKDLILEELRQSLTYNTDLAKRYLEFRKILDDKTRTVNKDCLLELALFDVHLGKLAWDEEVGENYDIEIAASRYTKAIQELVSRVNIERIERILLPIGNDMINVDNKRNTTTAGTPQDCDSRFAKMIKVAKQLLISVIDDLSSIAPVDVIVIPGNHDTETMFTVGEILDAYYHTNSLVHVYNQPTLRKYYQYSNTAIQFTHGNEEKHQDLGLIFATEQPVLWAQAKHRFCQLGHFHKAKKISYVSVDEHQGFQVQILPSLSGKDAWHNAKAYSSMKAAKAFLFKQNEGQIGEFTYTVI